MGFVYAPPPPPPSKTKSGTKQKKESKIPNNLDLCDLPTHLPTSSGLDDKVEYKSEDKHVDNAIGNDDQLLKEKLEDLRDDKNGSPIFVPGTTITLQTEEDIAKWIEERKKNWPTNKNIEMKQKRREEERQRNEVSIKRTSEDLYSKPLKKSKNVCKFFQQHKRCKFGNKCKNSHELTIHAAVSSTSSVKVINNIPVLIPQRFKNEPDASSLFKKLVQKDQFENENNLVLDFIQYVNENNLIDHKSQV